MKNFKFIKNDLTESLVVAIKLPLVSELPHLIRRYEGQHDVFLLPRLEATYFGDSVEAVQVNQNGVFIPLPGSAVADAHFEMHRL